MSKNDGTTEKTAEARKQDEVSTPEQQLAELREIVGSAHTYLVDTFFIGNTLDLWQTGATEESLPGFEERDLTAIQEVLNSREIYLQKAHHIEDMVSLLFQECSQGWVSIVALTRHVSKSEAASLILGDVRTDLLEIKKSLEEFIDSEAFSQAFSISVDETTKSFQFQIFL